MFWWYLTIPSFRFGQKLYLSVGLAFFNDGSDSSSSLWCIFGPRLDAMIDTWNPSIYNILRWVAWTMGQSNCLPRVWCSNYYFFIILFIDSGHSKVFIFIFYKKNKKINWKDFCKEFCEKLWKKNNALNIRRLVNETIIQHSDPV